MPYLLPETSITLTVVTGTQQVTGALGRLRAYVEIDNSGTVAELASSVAGQGVEVSAAGAPGRYRWALTAAERTFNTHLTFSGKSTTPTEAVIEREFDPEDEWYAPATPSTPAAPVPLAGTPFGFTWTPNQGTNLRVFIPAGTNIVSTTGALLPDAATNRASAGIPVTETYTGSGRYTFAIPAAMPPGWYAGWEAYSLIGSTFGGPGVDRLIEEGDDFQWGGAAVTSAPASGTQFGYYTSQPAIEDRWGRAETDQESDVDAALGAANPQVWREVLVDVDAKINRMARVWGYQTPIPTTSADWNYLSRLARDWGRWLLALNRGLGDTGSDYAGKMTKLRDDTEAALVQLFDDGIDALVLDTGETQPGTFKFVNLKRPSCTPVENDRPLRFAGTWGW